MPPIVQQGGDAQGEREGEIEANSMGLAYRDLISSALVNMWSVAALIEEIKRVKPEFIALSRLLSDADYRAERLKGWLASKDEDQYNRLQDPADVASIAQDPPLPFFILFEAADDPECRGMRLGVLGSILVAEVVLGALEPRSAAAREGREKSEAGARHDFRLDLWRRQPSGGHSGDRDDEPADRIHRASKPSCAMRARRSCRATRRRKRFQHQGESTCQSSA